MMNRSLLLLVALTLCCCIASLHAFPGHRCLCMRTTSNPVPRRFIAKIEVFPISGSCRRTEIIITRKNDSKVCVDPNTKWINNLLRKLNDVASSSPTGLPAAS